MSLLINDIAPDFNAYAGNDRFNFHRWLQGKAALVFSMPTALGPVCTDEIQRIFDLSISMEPQGCKVCMVVADTLAEFAKIKADAETSYGRALDVPIVDDTQFFVAKLWGMVPADAMRPYQYSGFKSRLVRSVFFIGPDRRLKAQLNYPRTVGRNFDEILRICDALRSVEEGRKATPPDWRPGDPVLQIE
jgi:thioredoxin-dependent peroxiredoxin